ncbi:MAG: hypothetical protein Edafosvirus19_20 [Edafosvirus sp.]|uniref:Uncharacterized protein n=1 Tax=Edafosvirus sp. TaxID=2487765 RepID=A0A3G4ZYE1_9VIRU|nr:MAG: hypothetical protein Edafosvirus19_20 [Edafosvirus sp.]
MASIEKKVVQPTTDHPINYIANDNDDDSEHDESASDDDSDDFYKEEPCGCICC